ncbi:methylosome protein 50-like isoform X2 [Pseudomyrmex gracilis]|nr:methylosome protein 50-like isoform X2 [Pseudomyrmex gracilis]XP_020292905.1 methylosome protein 50-like isoform X2 [Pseudomyrmex gracilis]XP_020292906.1 methylosome protein 50-like isoform X2 [Pseudomyrmex gracilis]XP_020292907.1 methylosome protein 50-like isoform X2 [Pseudomyrmex gracilis]XP_020292908.1 methylosome protein 50-like isoform X2 [Pseudomyrmex gracilis]XP_020292909.1 methylosome protein 50-like isoform X2 [Pseudomyrmex gracilis]
MSYQYTQVDMFSQQMPKDDKYLMSLSIYDEHNVFLGATTMNENRWTGLFYYYTNLPNSKKDNIATTIEMCSGVSEILVLDQNRFVVSNDDSEIHLYRIEPTEDEKPDLYQVQYRSQENSILTMSYFTTSNKLITGGLDCSIRIWDMNDDFNLTHNYANAHTYSVTCVAVDPRGDLRFASTSVDGDAIIWDIKDSRPATYIDTKLACELNAVSWKISSDPVIAIGADDGTVMEFDLRNTQNALYEHTACSRGISKLLYNLNPECAHQLACASYDTTVKVFDNELQIKLNDEQHSDFVTGLAWCKNYLYSCAWDGNLLKHEIAIESIDDDESD